MLRMSLNETHTGLITWKILEISQELLKNTKGMNDVTRQESINIIMPLPLLCFGEGTKEHITAVTKVLIYLCVQHCTKVMKLTMEKIN